MKLVILQSYALREGDIDWSAVRAQADECLLWPRTPAAETAARIGGAELAIVNKSWIDEAVLDACPNLRWVGLMATGTDSLDLAACRRRGVPVANVPGYSTPAVAQHVFSLLLTLCQCPDRYNAAVRAGCWQTDIGPQFAVTPQRELAGRVLGIVGYGAIGQAVARIALAFGMRVLVFTRTVRPQYAADGVRFVPFDELLAASDIVTLHVPATDATRGLIGEAALAKMKPGAILVNTARGALVDDAAAARALHSGRLAYFAADVVGAEPIRADNPLLGCANALLTPHIAWATAESLSRLAGIVAGNLRSYLAGRPENIVNGPFDGPFTAALRR